MLGLTLENARNIGLGLVGTSLIGSVLSAWIMKTIIQKVVTALVLLALAGAAWSQRDAMQTCADTVQASIQRSGTNVTVADSECSFFGFTIPISDPRDNPAE